MSLTNVTITINYKNGDVDIYDNYQSHGINPTNNDFRIQLLSTDIDCGVKYRTLDKTKITSYIIHGVLK